MGISTFSFLFLCIYMSCVLKPWCKVNWDSQMYKKDSSILLHIKYIWLTLLLLICSYIAAVHILIVWLKNIYILVGLYLSVHSSFHVWLNRFKVVEGFGGVWSTFFHIRLLHILSKTYDCLRSQHGDCKAILSSVRPLTNHS